MFGVVVKTKQYKKHLTLFRATNAKHFETEDGYDLLNHCHLYRVIGTKSTGVNNVYN